VDRELKKLFGAIIHNDIIKYGVLDKSEARNPTGADMTLNHRGSQRRTEEGSSKGIPL
jgi:hypothetical protein